MEHGELKGWELLRFVVAGKATFTIKNNRSGRRFTYKVSAKKYKKEDKVQEPIFYVKLLTGPRRFSYMGMIAQGTFRKTTANTTIPKEAHSFIAFSWFWNEGVSKGKVPPPFVQVWHEGKCGRCGRPLTVPESIKSGYGPCCSIILGIA